MIRALQSSYMRIERGGVQYGYKKGGVRLSRRGERAAAPILTGVSVLNSALSSVAFDFSLHKTPQSSDPRTD